jgi:multidrug resistance efflux pump
VKRLLLVLSLMGLVVLTGIGLVLAWPRVPLDATLSSPAPPPSRLVCYGYADHRHGLLFLQPTRAGRVIQVYVQEGQTVSKDTPLVQLDDHLTKLQEEEADLAVLAAQLQLTRARDGLGQYQARQAQAEAALHAAHGKRRAAQHALARKEELVKKELIDKVEADVGRDQLDEAKALVTVEQNRIAELQAMNPELEVKLADLHLKQSQAQLEQARTERQEYRLQAPVHGKVLRVCAHEGDLVGPTSPRPAVWLAPSAAWIVRTEVAQEFAGRVREGLAVQVEDEASGAMLATGRIDEIADCFLPRRQLSAEPTANNVGLALECVIALQEGHAPLRLGQRVRVRILENEAAGRVIP